MMYMQLADRAPLAHYIDSTIVPALATTLTDHNHQVSTPSLRPTSTPTLLVSAVLLRL